MKKYSPSLTIAIPSYDRYQDLDYAIQSIYNSNLPPSEILVVDDNSPNQNEIINILKKWQLIFDKKNIKFRYVISETNEGYDVNLHKLLKNSKSDYVMFLGNDDIILPNGVEDSMSFIKIYKFYAYSRTFVKFNNSKQITGISRFSNIDRSFSRINSSLNYYFRLSCFFSGLIFDREWALSKHTDNYNGTLYYQLFLFGCAYFESGIGYISNPIVGGRTDGIPLFGNSSSESNNHIPGSYSAKSRAIMWANILKIALDLDDKYKTQSYQFIHYEIKTRMSFHIFEMYSYKSIGELFQLRDEYIKLKIFNHPIPITFFLIVLILRKKSIYFFKSLRYLVQR